SAHHVAGLYRTDDFLAGRVASFITEGLTSGEQVIVLATASHWAAISERLAETGLAFRRAVTEGQLMLLDATEVLDGLTVDGHVSVDGFRAALTRFIVPATRQRVYGELVSLLAARGDLQTALAIEAVGHELAHILRIPLLCGYHLGGEQPLMPEAIRSIEAAHDRTWIEGKFLGEGFLAGLPAIVIATPEHRDAIKQSLSAHYFDISRLEAASDLIIVDAVDMLSRFMVDGMPDAARFTDAMIPLI